MLPEVTVCNMSFIGYPKTSRMAPLPWLGVHVPRFFYPLVVRGFRVRLWCIYFTSIVKDFCKHIDLELNKRWLGWPTRPDIYSLCARLSSGGKIARRIYHLIFCLQQVSRPAAASGKMRGHH